MEKKTSPLPKSLDKNRTNEELIVSKNVVLTFGSLYAKDLPNAFIIYESNSSFNPDVKFLNDNRYVMHDVPPRSVKTIEYLRPIRQCLVAGNELPVLVRHHPGERLRQHWKTWLPFLPEADTRDLNAFLENMGNSKLITVCPLQCLPKENHAIDPDVHYKILSKHAIPDMGAKCPRYMSLYDYTVPCMIKASHGAGGKGTFLAKTRIEAVKIISRMENEFRCPDPSISEVIEGITGNYCVQFYLYKTGDIEWLGCTNQLLGEDLNWLGGRVDWDEQDNLKNKLYDTVLPVKDYLHKNGYFGVVGIDVLSNKDGNFVVDVNARINGSTPLLLIAPHMAELGYPISEVCTTPKVQGDEMEVIEMFDQINGLGEGIVINMASAVVQDGKSFAYVCMFSKSEEGLKQLKKRIIS